jgi:cardiolipin synthase
MSQVPWIATSVFLVDLLLRATLSLRVIRRRLPVGVSLAWLSIILIFPFAGSFLYLLLGEYRLGPKRAVRLPEIHAAWRTRLAEIAAESQVSWASLESVSAEVARLAESALGARAQAGNRLELLGSADAGFTALLRDLDDARQTCHLEFYIWSPGGRADDVAAALLRAARRGVQCRLLVDAFGSADFLRSHWAKELRQGGVEVQTALPGGALRLFVARPDLRLHRKIAVIDGVIGYAGSLNVADPLIFKQDSGFGPWVDAFVRVQGPGVAALGLTFLADWALETGAGTDLLRKSGDVICPPPAGAAAVQVLPSGPDALVAAIEEIVLMAVYAARRELVLTTPYFIPTEALLTALLSAAGRGVKVTLIVPERVDSRLVHYASRAPQADLLRAGVHIALYRDGLLHTKSITVDDQLSLFGSLNLDSRSLRLDFEVTLAVYDAGFTAALRALQQSYLERSLTLDLATCRARSTFERFLEDAARLAGPLL